MEACDCQIYAAGTLAGQFRRRRTGRWEWDGAKVVAADWELIGDWARVDGPVGSAAAQALSPSKSAEVAESTRTTIMAATEAYLDSRRSRDIQPPTLAKYKTLVKQLREFASKRGYLFMEQLTVTDMDAFYAGWKDGIRSKAKKLERLKGFFKFALKRKWVSENLVEDLEPPEGASVPADEVPFTDAELTRIYKACDALGGPVPPGPGHRDWGGEDVKDFVLLSVYTGLRISDTSTFDIARRLRGNNVFLRMHKTRKEMWTWIPDWLVQRLRKRELRYGALIFHEPETCKSTLMRNKAEIWRGRLDKMFELAGPFEVNPHPHRLRYTFVRILLEKGVGIPDVAELIGDTEDVVRRHYAKWVRERQARLTNILIEAFSDQAPPDNLVEMPRTGTD